MISLALVGCGAVVHEMYAPVLLGRDRYKVQYVSDLDPAQAASAASLFNARVVETHEAVAAADAVIVTTPPSTHASIVTQSLKPGGLILCEKPFVTSYAEAAQLTSAARAADARLYVGHFRRVYPQVQLSRRLIMMGLIGDVTAISASEGGRFTWRAVSDYTTRDRTGGVLWDTGSHTLDMTLFAAALDGVTSWDLVSAVVDRDKEEPSHQFDARFACETEGRRIAGRLRLSRTEALPNMVTIEGSKGVIQFVTKLDNRLRLTTAKGSAVLMADGQCADSLECLDLQLRSVLFGRDDDVFAAERFLGQMQLLGWLADA